MSDVDVSTTAGVGALLSSVATATTRTAPSLDPTVLRARGLDHFVVDPVNISSRAQTETLRAVGAIDRTQASGAESNVIRPRGPEAGSRVVGAPRDVPVHAAVASLGHDLGTLVRSLGGSDEQAARVERQFAGKVADELGDPPRARLDDERAGASNWRGLEVWATGIEVVLDQDGGQVSVTYAGIGVGGRPDFLATAYPPTAAGRVDPPQLVDPAGRPADARTAARGVLIDLQGGGTPPLPSSAPRAAHRDDGAPPLQDSGYRGPFTGRSEGGQTFTLPPPMDGNRDGAADDKDTGFRSLLILRTGASTAPLAEAGLVRVKLDAVVPLRGQPPEITTTVDEVRRDGPVTPNEPLD